jgi:hypothetical protein
LVYILEEIEEEIINWTEIIVTKCIRWSQGVTLYFCEYFLSNYLFYSVQCGKCFMLMLKHEKNQRPLFKTLKIGYIDDVTK